MQYALVNHAGSPINFIESILIFVIYSNSDRFVKAVIPIAALRDRLPFTPLLEEVRHSRFLALIAQRSGPIGMHGAGIGTRLAASDHPINTVAQFGSHRRLLPFG